jgi:hypothetical protein
MSDRMTDRDMLGVVEVLLDCEPDEIANLKREFVLELLTRLQGLLKQEVAKRTTGRPRENTGAEVARLRSAGAKRIKAIRLVAKMRRKSEEAVEQAYVRHQRKAKHRQK